MLNKYFECAKLHIKIKNQRKDVPNKKDLELATRYDVIIIEDLDLQEMSKHNHYGKSIYDNSYNMFTNKLKYKLDERKKELVKVDRYYPSSKRCSNCGNMMDRDTDAAINIAIESFRLITKKNIELTI